MNTDALPLSRAVSNPPRDLSHNELSRLAEVDLAADGTLNLKALEGWDTLVSSPEHATSLGSLEAVPPAGFDQSSPLTTERILREFSGLLAQDRAQLHELSATVQHLSQMAIELNQTVQALTVAVQSMPHGESLQAMRVDARTLVPARPPRLSPEAPANSHPADRPGTRHSDATLSASPPTRSKETQHDGAVGRLAPALAAAPLAGTVENERVKSEPRDLDRGRQASGNLTAKTPEEWMESLQGFFDSSLAPSRSELPAGNGSRESTHKLHLDVLAALSLGTVKFEALKIDVHPGGVVRLNGRVHSDHQKQTAAHVASRVPGVHEIVNDLTIVAPSRPLATGPFKYWMDGGKTAKALHIVATLLVAMGIWFAADYERLLRPNVYPVTGTVEFEGQPAEGATVTFHPVSGATSGEKGGSKQTATILANGLTTSDGGFSLRTFGPNDGAPAGDYLVTVEWRKLVGTGEDQVVGPNVLPARYANPQTSGIKLTVLKGENKFPLRLLR